MKKIKFYALFLPTASRAEETMEYRDNVTKDEIEADFYNWKLDLIYLLLYTEWWRIEEDTK